jgi:hypothetical protein
MNFENVEFSGAKGKKQLLNYGSLIYLSFQEEGGVEFYACAEGFTKTKIRLRTKQNLGDFNYSSALFKIYPSFYNTEYVKIKKKFNEQKNLVELSNFEKRGFLMFFYFFFK